MKKLFPVVILMLVLPTLYGCGGPQDGDVAKVYHVAGQCFAVGAIAPERIFPEMLSVSDAGDAYEFSSQLPGSATPFYLKASGLGTYLFFDDAAAYLVSDGSDLLRAADLLSDVLTVDDSFESNAEWALESVGPQQRLQLRHVLSGGYLTNDGLANQVDAAAEVVLIPRKDCAEFPEASLDANGAAQPREFDDGSLFGFVDTHSHILSNFAFGGGGIFHGAAFHPLGIEHALPDCALFHGVDGRKDLFGFGFDYEGNDPSELLTTFVFGQTPEPNHITAGWPEFTDWPSAHDSSTHQVQYYKWLERAWLSGLRLVVQHATSNQIICDLIAGGNIQPVRYACNDMVAVDRIIEETYAMQAYIDAQEGGPGRGWFRIVSSPQQARAVIRGGKMAVILGIETSNLFDCFLVPSEEFPKCTEQDVLDKLDDYYARGVRVMFPVHKYDNAFSAGDGHKLFIELGNFIQTGHYSNYTTECDTSVPASFDKGPASFPGLNRPRDEYFSDPPEDMTGFADNPIGTLFPFFDELTKPPGTEEVCQAAGLTELGEFLLEQMMLRGMIIETDHLPRLGYKRAFELLEENDYPAAGTHGLNNFGELYRLGGVSKTGFGRCRAADATATMDDGFQARIQLIEDHGGFPAEGFGFDLNGFAGAPGPRFGPDRVCGSVPQEDPITYPFTSYAGDVTFTQPRVGNRVVDFNTEGLAHIGLVAELIEDVRRDGVSDAELEPLFKSAEAYIRMWEKAEQRAEALGP
jgi:microsomal dipeptidase-like Zn-dependent dipeptidase